MERASFTITMKNGMRFDAAMLMPTFEDGAMRPMLSFVCSGRMQSVPAADVEGVSFYAGGTHHCGHCDQPLPQTVVQG